MRWEYKVHHWPHELTEDELNEMGKEEWELAGIIPLIPSGAEAIFKRRDREELRTLFELQQKQYPVRNRL